MTPFCRAGSCHDGFSILPDLLEKVSWCDFHLDTFLSESVMMQIPSWQKVSWWGGPSWQASPPETQSILTVQGGALSTMDKKNLLCYKSTGWFGRPAFSSCIFAKFLVQESLAFQNFCIYAFGRQKILLPPDPARTMSAFANPQNRETSRLSRIIA